MGLRRAGGTIRKGDTMNTRYIVRFGSCAFSFFTEYHAAQFMRALRLNGTACTVEVTK